MAPILDLVLVLVFIVRARLIFFLSLSLFQIGDAFSNSPSRPPAAAHLSLSQNISSPSSSLPLSSPQSYSSPRSSTSSSFHQPQQQQPHQQNSNSITSAVIRNPISGSRNYKATLYSPGAMDRAAKRLRVEPQRRTLETNRSECKKDHPDSSIGKGNGDWNGNGNGDGNGVGMRMGKCRGESEEDLDGLMMMMDEIEDERVASQRFPIPTRNGISTRVSARRSPHGAGKRLVTTVNDFSRLL